MQDDSSEQNSGVSPVGNFDFLSVSDVEFLQQYLGCNFDNNSQAFLSTAEVSSSDDTTKDIDIIEEPTDVDSLVTLLELTTPSESRQALPPPASFNFPGKHNFRINFDGFINDNNVVYSSSRDKLYVAKGMPCIMDFMVSAPVPMNTTLRVMAIFIKPEHGNYNVHRCMNHAMEDMQNGVKACDHIIKCQNSQAIYVRNKRTLRRSILVPFNNPETGSSFSTYVFRFNCLTSCPGGLNRRPTRVIFTLEKGRQIIGRKSVEVKICSSPWRDCSNDDSRVTTNNSIKTRTGSVVTSSKKRKIERIDASIHHVSDMFQYVDRVVRSQEKENRTNQGPFTIIAQDREEYELLKQAKIFYEFLIFVRSLSPERLNLLMGGQRTKKLKKKKE